MEKEEYKELSRNSRIGDKVKWTIISGYTFYGILKEWDNNVAVVELDEGYTMCVEC